METTTVTDDHAILADGVARLLAEESESSWVSQSAFEVSLARRAESWGRCGTRYWYRATKHYQRSKNIGVEYRPTSDPCHTAGCPNCSLAHAYSEIMRWRKRLRSIYGDEPLTTLVLTSPDAGAIEVRARVGRFNRKRPVAKLLGPTFGVIAMTADGPAYKILATEITAAHMDEIATLWTEVGGSSVLSEQPPPGDDIVEIAARMRCDAEQAPFKIAAEGTMPLDYLMDYLSEEHGRNRVVHGPGFRSADFSATRHEASSETTPGNGDRSDLEDIAENAADVATGTPCTLGHPGCMTFDSGQRTEWWKLENKVLSNKATHLLGDRGSVTGYFVKIGSG